MRLEISQATCLVTARLIQVSAVPILDALLICNCGTWNNLPTKIILNVSMHLKLRSVHYRFNILSNVQVISNVMAITGVFRTEKRGQG